MKRTGMWKKTAAVLAGVLLGTFAPAAVLANNVQVVVNDKKVQFVAGAEAYEDNGYTMIPVRAVGEALGANVFWIEDKQMVQITRYGKMLSITLGLNQMSEYRIENGATVFEKNIDLPVPAIQHGADRGYCVYVPLRSIVEALDASVDWNEAAQTAYIRSNRDYDWHNTMTVAQIATNGPDNLFQTTGVISMIDGIPYLWDGEDFGRKIQITDAGGDAWLAFFPDMNFASVKVEMSAVTALGDSGEVVIPLRRSSTNLKLLETPRYARTDPPAFSIGAINIEGDLVNVNFFYGFWNKAGQAEFTRQEDMTYRYEYVFENEYMGGFTLDKSKTFAAVGSHISALTSEPKYAVIKIYAQKRGFELSNAAKIELRMWRDEAKRCVYVEILSNGDIMEVNY